MKKYIALLGLLVSSFMSYGQWKVKNYVDEFGDKTPRKYMMYSDLNGLFSNSATENSKLIADIVVSISSESNVPEINFDLYEYGRGAAVGKSIGEATYALTIKLAGDKIFSCSLYPGEKSLYFNFNNSVDKESFIGFLKTEKHPIKCLIEIRNNYRSSTYNFSINPIGFANTFKNLQNSPQSPNKFSKKTDIKIKLNSSMESINDKEINWISLDEVQQKMKQAPRKVYIDVYTDWCGWCKVMDKKTFSDPNVIAYINKYFYAVKFNAEQTDSVHFMGSHYGMEGRTNQFAIQLLRGQMSYPTTVIMEEGFQNPQIIPGYLEVKAIEPILKYIGGNYHKTTPWEEFSKSYKLTW